jgi:hypothetical protein
LKNDDLLFMQKALSQAQKALLLGTSYQDGNSPRRKAISKGKRGRIGFDGNVVSEGSRPELVDGSVKID